LVKKVFPPELQIRQDQQGDDGTIRSADMGYKIPGENVFRMTIRPIHKLIMILLRGKI
jgi:hypothetical protein